MSQAVAVKKPNRADVLKYLEDRITTFGDLAGAMVDPKKILKTAVMLCMERNEKLADAAMANPRALFVALVQLTEAGLEPDGIEAALVPYGNDIQAQPMYQGLVKLLYMAGAKTIYADVVCLNEISAEDGGAAADRSRFEWLGKGQVPIHRPILIGDRGRMAGAYATVELGGGGVLSDWMGEEEIKKAMGCSRSAGQAGGPWAKWPAEQWKKTVIKRLTKTAPKSERLRAAMRLDESDYVDTVASEVPKKGAAGFNALMGKSVPALTTGEAEAVTVVSEETETK